MIASAGAGGSLGRGPDPPPAVVGAGRRASLKRRRGGWGARRWRRKGHHNLTYLDDTSLLSLGGYRGVMVEERVS